MEDPVSDTIREKDVYDSVQTSRFQFKAKAERRSKRGHEGLDRDDNNNDQRAPKRCRSDAERESRRRHRDSRRRHKHRRSDDRRHVTPSGDYDNPEHRYRESVYDGLDEKNASVSGVDSEAAFRESLFDAMADDEGAQYWEGVYGQPVHVYPNTKPGPDGKLERMSDEEYADYVRTKMWEKSHQHVLEERAARERARKERKEQQDYLEGEVAGEETEREKVRRQMEESLRRGEDRKRAKEAEASWARYLSRWDEFKNPTATEQTESSARTVIPWPIASGKASHVEKDEIERFLKASSAWKDNPAAMLKLERVRWHPDKMQQRFGQHIDLDTMKLVTAVFQVVDRLWNDRSRPQK